MRLLWINDEASFVGGAETYIYQTAEELTRHSNVENILMYNVDCRIDNMFAKAFTFTTVIADLKEQIKYLKPDIIYVHQVKDIKILESLLEIDIPVIGFIHDHKYFCLREHKYTTIGHNTCTKAVGMDCYTCLGFINKQNSFPYLSVNSISSVKYVQNILKQFDEIIVASEYMKSHLLLHEFNEEKLSKIVLFSEDIVTPKVMNTQNEKRFLFVGQLVRGKGVDILLEAFANMQDNTAFLDICGDGKQREELENMAKNLGISNRVYFHGKISPENLTTYYSNAHIVVIPSRAPETFNLVGLEAMKHSKAVIATDVGGIGEWLETEKTGFTFPSNDSNKLTDILEYTIDNPQKINHMGVAGYDKFHHTFTAQKHCKKLYNVLKKHIKKDAYVI